MTQWLCLRGHAAREVAPDPCFGWLCACGGMAVLRVALVLALVLAGVGLAWAQAPVVNPRTVEFAPSADHDTLLPADLGGGPVVASYEARFFVVGASTPVCATNLGKPTPVSSLISLPLPLTCVPASWGTRYVVRVAALGPTGEGVSVPSGPFASVNSPAAPGEPVVRR